MRHNILTISDYIAWCKRIWEIVLSETIMKISILHIYTTCKCTDKIHSSNTTVLQYNIINKVFNSLKFNFLKPYIINTQNKKLFP